MEPKCYIGIDPGEKGGISCILLRKKDGCTEKKIITTKMLGEKELVLWFSKIKFVCDNIEVIIEKQEPMPTRWIDKSTGEQKSTVLASTSILYGNYRMVRGILSALDIKYTEVLPREWQTNHYGMKRVKTEKKNKWKGRLKELAKELFKDIKVTLEISDSLLLVNYLYEMRIVDE